MWSLIIAGRQLIGQSCLHWIQLHWTQEVPSNSFRSPGKSCFIMFIQNPHPWIESWTKTALHALEVYRRICQLKLYFTRRTHMGIIYGSKDQSQRHKFLPTVLTSKIYPRTGQTIKGPSYAFSGIVCHTLLFKRNSQNHLTKSTWPGVRVQVQKRSCVSFEEECHPRRICMLEL